MHGRAGKEYIFRSYNTPAFRAARVGENPFKCQCKKKKRLKDFKGILLIVFNDIVAVKGLMMHNKIMPVSLQSSPFSDE